MKTPTRKTMNAPPAAINSEVPGNSRLTKANDSPNEVTNMTATAQLECAEMKSRVG